MSAGGGRRAAVAATVTLLAGIAVAIVVLSAPSRADVAQATAPAGGFVQDVTAGGRACQAIEPLAHAGDRVVMTLGVAGAQPGRALVVAGDGTGAPSRSAPLSVPPGAHALEFRVRPALRANGRGVQVCVVNPGPATLKLAGVPIAGGRTLAVRVRAAATQAALDRAGQIADRFVSARAGDLGRGALVLAGVALLLATGLALVLVVRTARDV